MNHFRESGHRERLGQSGHALDQDVLVAQERHQQAIQEHFLSHNHFVRLAADAGEHFALPLHPIADLFYVNCHRFVSL